MAGKTPYGAKSIFVVVVVVVVLKTEIKVETFFHYIIYIFIFLLSSNLNHFKFRPATFTLLKQLFLSLFIAVVIRGSFDALNQITKRLKSRFRTMTSANSVQCLYQLSLVALTTATFEHRLTKGVTSETKLRAVF